MDTLSKARQVNNKKSKRPVDDEARQGEVERSPSRDSSSDGVKMPYISTKPRPYSQDFSGNSKTDTSFGPACDVNNIVRHYENTGIDPFITRKQQERFAPASVMTFEEAMRQKAELDSAFLDLPASVRAQHANDPLTWLEYTQNPPAPEEPLEAALSPPADPAPQGASDD